jgi:hypothetical protein
MTNTDVLAAPPLGRSPAVRFHKSLLTSLL